MGRFEQARLSLGRAYAARRSSAPQVDSDGYGGQRGEARTPAGRSTVEVPYGLRLATAWAWRLLLLVAAFAVVFWIVARLRLVLIPLAIALLMAAFLAPAVGWLRRWGRLPPSPATALVVVAGIAVVAGTLTLVITQFVTGFPELAVNSADGIAKIEDWLRTGPLHLSNPQLSSTGLRNWITEHRSSLTTSAMTVSATALEVLAGAFLVLFATFFFLRDGHRIWRFLVRLLPLDAREPVGRAGEQSWLTLVAYVRATVIVALIDAVGIGLALLILRVPFAFPLAALVFLSSFVPIVGATVSGAVAVLVALVSRGPLIALLVLISVLVVQQVESHILQPFIMSRAVSIHPLAVIVAIATGGLLAGIIGALVAVPVVAVLNTGVRHLAGHRDEPPPDSVVVSAAATP